MNSKHHPFYPYYCPQLPLFLVHNYLPLAHNLDSFSSQRTSELYPVQCDAFNLTIAMESALRIDVRPLPEVVVGKLLDVHFEYQPETDHD